MEIKVGISNRHVHLTKDTLEKLFGKDYMLHEDRPLSQPGQFASVEKITIKTQKNEIKNVRILGPLRDYNQVEISKTDSYTLGLKPPVRNSGNLENSETITLVGPNGEVTLENSTIIATRHIHINTNDLEKYGLSDNQIVQVRINTEKGGILDNVIVKSSPNYELELHLDTDDANGFLLSSGDIVEIIK